ncbi:unnamed protein product [Oikopleura dioica]|uniref:RING-type domain-containing protein n=1 Tax=Oikopleura dioica TaxID=34765 RepID=E4XBC5_OIKDI|nr:unnamed protein product [Oikopleura dioica]
MPLKIANLSLKDKLLSHLGNVMPGRDFSNITESTLQKFLPEGQVYVKDDDDTVDDYGFKPLERAASDENLAEVKKLLRAGANTLIPHHGLFPYEIKEENRKHKIEVQKLKEQIEKKNSQGPYNEKVTELEDMVTKLEIEKQDMKKELEQVQECLKNTTKEAKTMKKQAQGRIRQISEILRETAREFGVENDFESDTNVKDLEDQITTLKTINSDLETISKKYDQMTSCCICEEKYESTGERSPVKLRCSHIICGFCANSWLTQKGNKASCPQCRETYRAGDIRAVNLNSDF